MNDPDRARLLAFITRLDTTAGPEACWPWRGALTGDGYGRIGRPAQMVHRYVYELLRGPIPDGLVIDHACHDGATCTGGVTCPHRACANPAHLQPVRQAVNVRRSPLTMANINAAKTHCPRNHAYTPENTRHSVGRSGPKRDCRTCSKELAAARRRQLA